MWGTEGEVVPHAGTLASGLWSLACAWSTSLDFSRKTQQLRRNGKQRGEILQQLQQILKHSQKSSFAVLCQVCILFCVCQDPAKHKQYRLLQNFCVSVQTLLGAVHRDQTEKHCAYFGQEPSQIAMKCCSINKYICANKCIKNNCLVVRRSKAALALSSQDERTSDQTDKQVDCWLLDLFSPSFTFCLVSVVLKQLTRVTTE